MIAISMRAVRHIYPGGGEEMRDALARNWWRFLEQALPGVPVAPLPNIGGLAADMLQCLPVTGLILSGGDDWGVFPERDAAERELFLLARRASLPVLGVCRGAQVVNRLMGGNTGTGFGQKHAGTRHIVRISPGGGWLPESARSLEVNSYHNCGIERQDLAPGLTPWAFADDGSVEAFGDADGRLAGIMWHPEREAEARAHDIHLFQFLKGGRV